MQKFLARSTFFVMITLGVCLLIQLVISLWIRDKVIKGSDNLDLYTGQDNEIVFIGSSRCNSHFPPALFARDLHMKSVNLGIEGHSELSMHYLRLDNYLKKNKPPRFAILNIDPFATAGDFENSEPDYFAKDAFSRFAFMPSSANEAIVDYFHFNPAEKYLPLYALLRNRSLLDCIDPVADKKWKADGYFRRDETWDTMAKPVASQRSIRRYYDANAKAWRETAKMLKSLDSLCKRHRMQLLCVQTPIYKAAYDSNYYSYTGRICAEAGVPFFDCCLPSIDDDISNFFDIEHMNTKGVNLMTQVLMTDSSFRSLMKKGP